MLTDQADFIELTDSDNGQPVFCKLSSIGAVIRFPSDDTGVTYIRIDTGHTLGVTETPEEILALEPVK